MALNLEANYSKKIGLPGFSSHQFSLTVQIELSDLSKVETESERLYAMLQGCVDRDIQQTGFLPANGSANGNGSNGHHANGNGSSNGNASANGNGRTNGQTDDWACTEKQKGFILSVVADHQLDKREIDALAQQRFGKGVRHLNRLQASGLIDELLETYGKGKGNGRYAGKGRRMS